MKKSIIIIDDYYKNPDEIRKELLDYIEQNIITDNSNGLQLEADEWHFQNLEHTYTDLPGLCDHDKTIMGRVYSFYSSYISMLCKDKLEKIMDKKIYQLSDMKCILTNCLSYPNPIQIASLDTVDKKYEEWIGIIFLTPNAPFDGGISTYNYKPLGINTIEKALLHNNTMKQHFIDELHVRKYDISRYWEKDCIIENVYNRLVLFKKDLFYNSTTNFGCNLLDTRIVQQFSFLVLRNQ